MKYVFFLFCLTSFTAFGQINDPSSISNETLSAGRAAYTSAITNGFARSYDIDGQTLKWLLQTGASAVRIENGLTNSGQKVVIISAVGGSREEGTKYLIQYETNICPPSCDVALVPAIVVDEATAAKYIQNFGESKKYEKVSSFIIPKETIEQLGLGKNLRVYNVTLDGRKMAITATGSDTRDMGTVLLSPTSTICPPSCD